MDEIDFKERNNKNIFLKNSIDFTEKILTFKPISPPPFYGILYPFLGNELFIDYIHCSIVLYF